MLKLTKTDITLAQSSTDKFSAIKKIAASLTAKGYVEDGYVEGMLNREKQNSTFLGNGIAIPHGTTVTRSLVKATGVSVHHFPQGVEWGEGNIVYVAIGIAAKSDEHLEILKQLTKVLSSEGVEERLRNATTKDDLIALLNGDVQLKADFNPATIQLNFLASDMIQMSAVAGGLLKNIGCADAQFVADLVTKKPTHLGEGLWLVASDNQVLRTGISFISTASTCEFAGEKVRALIAIAACNNAHQSILDTISKLVFDHKQNTLMNSSAEQIIALLNGEEAAAQITESGNTAIYAIKNTHGLHARPGAMLVAEAKRFDSTIRVLNLDGDGKAVNAKSLMKVIGLGVKHGHRLQFSAEGPDAELALESIGKAIASGLGEG